MDEMLNLLRAMTSDTDADRPSAIPFLLYLENGMLGILI